MPQSVANPCQPLSTKSSNQRKTDTEIQAAIRRLMMKVMNSKELAGSFRDRGRLVASRETPLATKRKRINKK